MNYFVRKLFFMLLTIFLVSFLVFISFQLIPGDPALSMLGTEATPERLQALRSEMGLDQPLLWRFFTWALHFLKGDMGVSYSYQMPVADMLLEKFPVTLALALMGFCFVLATALPLGLFAARQGGLIDLTIQWMNQAVMAIPPFFAGILLTWLLGIVLKLFTPGGYVDFSRSPGRFFAYLIVPAIAVGLPKAAMTVKLLRDTVVREYQKDYVRTALSKGNTISAVLSNHVLKNAMIPVITFLAMVLADLIAGSIMIEQVFGIPGIGRLLIVSISNRDYPVVQAVIVCIAALILVLNFLADLLYQVLDPRVAAARKG